MENKIDNEIDWRIRIFDSLSFPTLILKPDQVVLTANTVFLEKFNTELDQVIGKTCYDVFYHDKCPHENCPFVKVLEQKKGQSIIRRVTTLTGKHLWEDRCFSPILDDNGDVTYIIESVRDITRMKNLEIALRETEAFLEKAISGSPLAIVAADRYGNILLMNPVAEKLFGYSFKEAARILEVKQLYPDGIAIAIMEKLRNEQQGGPGKLSATRTTILNAEDKEIPVEINASLLYEDGEEVASIGIYTDLRDKIAAEKKLKETQNQIVQSEKMASLGKLAAGVAHEINNPLTGILLYANLIRENTEENNPQLKNLQYVLEDAERCKDIVKNLLAYSRQTTPTREICSMNTLVEQSLGLIRDQKLFLKINVVKNLSEEKLLVHVDKNQISQVIINLIINAADAINKQGIITLRTYQNKTTHMICLEVEDTGSGIKKENAVRIFDPFFTTKEHGKGTGLGLSIAYGIIKENSGNISIKKTSPHGTIFMLELPPVNSRNEELIY